MLIESKLLFELNVNPFAPIYSYCITLMKVGFIFQMKTKFISETKNMVFQKQTVNLMLKLKRVRCFNKNIYIIENN